MVRVAFQGEPGAFSEQAIQTFFHHREATAVPHRTLRDVFTAVQSGDVPYGVIPVENSTAGTIRESYDLLFEHSLWICGQVAVHVNHCLLGLPGDKIEAIRRVYSHPQALAQCETFLRTLDAEAIAVYDTAGSAANLVREPESGAAAIASEAAAKLYGLEVLARNIQDSPDNTTAFYVLTREASPPAPAPGENRTVIVLALADDDHPGSLFWCLGTLAFWRVNLLRIESRPSGRRPWHYLFYLELQGHVGDEACRAALTELEGRTALLRVLGSFPATHAT